MTAASSRPWARIDARGTAPVGVGANTRLCGLSLLGRQIRTAARLGWAGAEVLVETATARAEVEAALQRDPPPPGFPVEIGAEGPTTEPRVPLAVRSVYTRDALATAAETGTPPVPLAEINDRADLAVAERRLFDSIRKPVSHDGVAGYYLMRPISNRISRGLLDTKITPNQVTVVAGLLGVAGGLLASTGGHWRVACAGLLVWAAAVIDCVDGDIARLRMEGSRLGQWLDTLADDATTMALVAGLGVGLTRDGAGQVWTVVGVAAAVVWAVTEAKLYVDLNRLGLPIDTAQYPWFFGDPSKPPAADAGLLSRAFNLIGYLFKRDAFMTMIAIGLLFDWRKTATAALAAGNFVMFALLGIQLYLKRRGSTSAPQPG
jgi:phosphatidylglycerophosphate synthase